MREFSQTLSDFTKGLRPDANTPRNSGYATELYNTRCGVAGLEVPPLIAYPISGAPTVGWPLPQLLEVYDLNFANTGLFFVKYASNILTINKVNGDYNLTPVFSKAGISTRFTVADFGYYQLWNGSGLTIKRQINEALTAYEWSEILIEGAAPPVTCVCNFRGQLVAGMYTSSVESPGDVEDNLVAWSEIGSVDPIVMFDQSAKFIDRRRGPDIEKLTQESDVLISTGGTNDGYASHIEGMPQNTSIFTSTSFLVGGLSGGVEFHSWVRFPNCPIPQGATIVSAKLRFTSYETAYADADLDCYFVDADNPSAPATGAAFQALVLTDAVAWDAGTKWNINDIKDTPELKTILQAIVDRAGYAQGNAVMFVMRNAGSPSGGTRTPRSGDYETEASRPKLMITYSYSTITPGPVKYSFKRTGGNYRVGPTSVVRRVLPLGNGVMVYCSDKIFYLKAASAPVATFGVVPVLDLGIPSTFCVEGDDKEHVFIDTNKQVWRVEEGQEPKLLGYKEFIGAMSGTLVITRNVALDDYYISNGSKTYLLSPFGLSEWFQCPTSLVWEDANKRLIGPIVVGSNLYALMATDVFDLGIRAIKTITAMEAGSTGQILTGNVDYKYKATDASFTSSRFKTASNQNVITSLVSGVDFKFRVKGADYTKFDLDYLTVKCKYVDKRNIRGAYATDAKVLSRTSR